MADPRYARKWGVTKLPAIVYFRKRFPSIYRGKTLLSISRRNYKYFQFSIAAFLNNFPLTRWSTQRTRRVGLAAQEQVPSTGAEHLHVYADRDHSPVCHVHRFLVVLFPVRTSGAHTASETSVIKEKNVIGKERKERKSWDSWIVASCANVRCCCCWSDSLYIRLISGRSSGTNDSYQSSTILRGMTMKPVYVLLFLLRRWTNDLKEINK